MSTSLKIIFAGTPEFSAVALQGLLSAEHEIVAVYTQPDRPAGRGQKVSMSAVKQLALAHQLPIYQPKTLRDAEVQSVLASHGADVMVVVAYGLILPAAVLAIPKLGCLNIHGSLLPKWRGAAPIQRAILAGDATTGITIMQMDEGLDTGNMLYTLACPITQTDTSESLYLTLAQMGKTALLATLQQLIDGTTNPIVQENDQASYAHKISKEEAQINWRLSAEQISQSVRGFNPWPVAYTLIGDKPLRIWQAEVIERDVCAYQPGEIIAFDKNGLDVACKTKALRLLKMQLPGGRVLSIADIFNAKPQGLALGSHLG